MKKNIKNKFLLVVFATFTAGAQAGERPDDSGGVVSPQPPQTTASATGHANDLLEEAREFYRTNRKDTAPHEPSQEDLALIVSLLNFSPN